MKTTNLGDKYTHRITLRLSDEQFDFLAKMSEILGVTPSEYIRMTVNTGMVATKNSINVYTNGLALDPNIERKDGSTSNENVKTDKHNIIQ